MKNAIAIVLALATGLAVGAATCARHVDGEYMSRYENVMGTSLDLKVLARSDTAAAAAEHAVLDEIARLTKILSGYDAESEFSQWMRTSAEPIPASPELIEVLSAFDEWRTRTSGALDPATEALAGVWRRAASESRLPEATELQSGVGRVRQRHWSLDRAASTVTRTSDVPLMLHSFTKSFVADRAARRALTVPGVTGVLLNAGGDVVVRGDWSQTVGVSDPVANADNATPPIVLRVRDAVVATSGSYKRGFEVAGRHYSHILDPRTGQPADDVLRATVASTDAVEAGALATALCVLSAEERDRLVSTRPGAAYALVFRDGRRIESPGWRTLALRAPARPVFPSPVEAVYAAEPPVSGSPVALTITLELARLDAMGRRPYVAVWIEDKDRFPVRTIALWYDGKARWLPDLRAWHRGDRLRAMAEGTQIVDAVTTATRPSGRYSLQWDGKDAAGKPVQKGQYTICIEAAREHGTYQIIRQPVDIGGRPSHLDLPGGAEVQTASIDVHEAARN